MALLFFMVFILENLSWNVQSVFLFLQANMPRSVDADDPGLAGVVTGFQQCLQQPLVGVAKRMHLEKRLGRVRNGRRLSAMQE